MPLRLLRPCCICLISPQLSLAIKVVFNLTTIIFGNKSSQEKFLFSFFCMFYTIRVAQNLKHEKFISALADSYSFGKWNAEKCKKFWNRTMFRYPYRPSTFCYLLHQYQGSWKLENVEYTYEILVWHTVIDSSIFLKWRKISSFTASLAPWNYLNYFQRVR